MDIGQSLSVEHSLQKIHAKRPPSAPALNDTLEHHHRSVTRIVYLKHREKTVFVENIKFLMESSPYM